MKFSSLPEACDKLNLRPLEILDKEKRWFERDVKETIYEYA
jgi:hypothetical protein